jgi:hypothetical protein
MRNLIIITVLIFVTNIAFGQKLAKVDWKTGKNYSLKDRAKIKKKWSNTTNTYDIEVAVDVINKKVKTSSLDFSSDAFTLNMKKFNYKGKDLKQYFSKPVEILTVYTEDDSTFLGNYVDPVTKCYLFVYIKFIDKDRVDLWFEIDRASSTDEAKSKGTIIPLDIFTLNQKN